jgi:hypothetical protein
MVKDKPRQHQFVAPLPQTTELSRKITKKPPKGGLFFVQWIIIEVEDALKKRLITRRRLPLIARGGALLAVIAAVAVFAVYRSRPRPTWYVEPLLEASWGELLERAPAPPPFVRSRPYDPAAGIGKGRVGLIIATSFPAEATDGGAPASAEDPAAVADGGAPPPEGPPPLLLFPGLYQSRADYQGAIPLALDPWLVFRKTADPPLRLERVLAEGPGALILPGAEPDAVYAWVAQLLQASPGSFPLEKRAWEEAEQRLVLDPRPFQPGALTYTWYDGWIRLLQDETAWVYAPLSRTRGLSSYDAGRLDAAVFPIPADWNTYGLQAEVLWAIPHASEKQAALLEEAQAWLSSAETQGIIAEILGWIPAQSGSVPYDTLAREAQVAWFSSGYIWQSPRQTPFEGGNSGP